MMSRPASSIIAARNSTLPSTARGFTLVELMVVMVVLALLATLTLAGLAGVRDRVKADKTRSTLRKLHEMIVPQFEDYTNRRVRAAGSAIGLLWTSGTYKPTGVTITSSTSTAANRLWGLRVAMTAEMPDQWNDVAATVALPSWAVTAPVKRYGAVKNMGSTSPSSAYESAECLAMIVMRGGLDADLIESFRTDEIGDVDQDQRPEILDGWGKPIGFIRWPVGFDSPFLARDASVNPDPCDPMRRSAAVNYPTGMSSQTDYGVTPLIFSCGPDQSVDPPSTGSSATTPNYGGYVGSADLAGSSWLAAMGLSNGSVTCPVGGVVASNRERADTDGRRAGASADTVAVRDNITNYNLLKK